MFAGAEIDIDELERDILLIEDSDDSSSARRKVCAVDYERHSCDFNCDVLVNPL